MFARHCTRIDVRAMARSTTETRVRSEFLVRSPGLRVRRPGEVLAVVFVHRIVLVVVSHGPRTVANVQETEREQALAGAVPDFVAGHRTVLRRGTDVASADESRHRGVLAMVGRAF